MTTSWRGHRPRQVSGNGPTIGGAVSRRVATGPSPRGRRGSPRAKPGGIQVSLTTEGDTSPDSALAVERYPAGTEIEYMRGEIDIPDAVKPALANVHVVVHGIDENGNGTLDMDQEERSSLTEDLPREATAPALCGELTAVASGAVQTGGGGTAETGMDTTALAGLGLFGLAGLGIVTRRRVAADKA